MLQCCFLSRTSKKKVLSWFCQFVFNFSFARRHSLMWNISQGCTTGMPAPMLGPPSATSAATASQGSLLMASPVKVGAHFFLFTCLISLSSVSANPSLIMDTMFCRFVPSACFLLAVPPEKGTGAFFVSDLICSCRSTSDLARSVKEMMK